MGIDLQTSGEIVVRIPPKKNRPYNPMRQGLYTPDELMTGWQDGRSLDQRIESYFKEEGAQLPKDQNEALCQRIHDDYIDRLVLEFVRGDGLKPRKPRRLVGIMGGHAAGRASTFYATVAELAYGLTQAGFCVVTGGGPGVMEGANLGAYMSAYHAKDLKNAVAMLGGAPTYPPYDSEDPNNAARRRKYVEAASAVRRKYPTGAVSLGVPTWAYPDEPTGQFATHIAKYFANSIREDGLLAIASCGVVFAPGTAGTSQEIFQDAVHNSYWSFNYRAPMVFLGSDVYRRSPSLYDVVLAAANRDGYSDYLTLVDDAKTALAFIEGNPPVKKPGSHATIGQTGYRLSL